MSHSPEKSSSKSRSPSLRSDESSPGPSRRIKREQSRSFSRSRTPVRHRYRSRSYSRSRSPPSRYKYRSRSRSLSRDYRRRYRSRERRSYRSRSRSTTRSLTPWKSKMDWLIERGYIKQSDIEEHTMQQLEDMSDALSDVVLARFSEVNFNRISNKNGFLLGIIRRIQQDGLDKGAGDFDMLTRTTRHKIKSMISKGILEKEDVDMRMCRALSEASPDLALEALSKFSKADLKTVRSKTGYLLGILKRLKDPDYIQYDRRRY